MFKGFSLQKLQPAPGTQQPATGTRQPAPGTRQPATSTQQPATCNLFYQPKVTSYAEIN